MDPFQGGGSAVPEPAESLVACRTGADANARRVCRIVGTVNSIQA